MAYKITRKTGFYAMGSPLDLLLDGQKVARINHQETLVLDFDEGKLSVRFFFLKSKERSLEELQDGDSLVIKMNPKIVTFYILFYVGLFLLMALLAISQQITIILLGILLYLVGYFCLGVHYSKQAYIIEEETNG
jgi:hypothetical protein